MGIAASALALKTLLLVLQGVFVRRRKVTPRLPQVAPTAMAAAELEAMLALVNRITGLVAGKSRHACFYRSYPLAVLLRQRGLPVELNIGLMGLQPRQRLRGHCWLSLRGSIINESEPLSSAAYPDLLGDNGLGVRYWVKAGQGDYVSRRAAL